MLSSVFAKLLNLAHSNNPAANLTDLEGRSFVISIDEFPQDIAVIVENNRIVPLSENAIAQADVTISGSVKAIIAMIQDSEHGLDSDELYIAGKINTAKRFQTFLGALAIDWEHFLNQFVPNDMAKKGAEAIEQGIHFAKGSMNQLLENLQQYLIEDKKLFVTQSEFNQLAIGINELNQRLAQQLALLSALPVHNQPDSNDD